MGRVVTRLRLERAEHMEVKEAHEGQSRERKRREEVGWAWRNQERLGQKTWPGSHL